MFKKGQRVRWGGFSANGSDYGTVIEDQTCDRYVSVKWDSSPSINSGACPSMCYLVGGPILSAELCEWIIRNLLTEEQLDVVRKGDAYPLRYATYGEPVVE